VSLLCSYLQWTHDAVDGVSRAKLSSVMATYLALARQGVAMLIVRMADIAQNTTLSMEDMWWKMDFPVAQ
jgi:hypothetical protein